MKKVFVGICEAECTAGAIAALEDEVLADLIGTLRLADASGGILKLILGLCELEAIERFLNHESNEF